MASKPAIFTLDDDPEVLQAINSDLRREFGKDYRIIRANDGAAALETLKQLHLRSEHVALFLIDQRMPEMTGTEFLAQARKIYPEAMRVLLTAYADTNAAIQAINDIRLHHYLMKPWDPPEQNLFPVLHDLLEQWVSEYYKPLFEGVRVIGHQWSPDSHRIKDFLARNRVPYKWHDVEKNPEEANQLLEFAGVRERPLPIVVFNDGTAMSNPDNAKIADMVGLRTQAEQPSYDLAIIGGGPAGLAAAVYGASEGLRTILIEREAPGGQAGTSSRIENYLGFPSGLSGSDLARRGVQQAERFGVEILTPAEVVTVRQEDPFRVLELSDGSEITTKAVLISTGVSYNRLQVAGCDELTGAGVYYGAAMTEAPSVAGQDVFIVGAGNSAGQAAMFFAQHAKNVNIVVRGDDLAKSMSHYLIEQIDQTPNIHVQLNTEIFGVHGSEHLTAVTLINNETKDTRKCEAAALFVFIGAAPRTDWLADVVLRDARGFIVTGSDLIDNGRRPRGFNRDPFLLETSVPGIFAAGDVRHHSVKRVASAVGEGSIAVQFVHQYLSEL